MNSKEKRAMREAVRQKRIELLSELDNLEIQLANETDPKRQIELYEKIVKIGQALQRNVHNPVASRYLEKPYEFKPIIIPNKNIKPIPLTVEMYLEFKKRGLTDTQIAMQVGQTKGYVDRFKREQGITRESWKCEA